MIKECFEKFYKRTSELGIDYKSLILDLSYDNTLLLVLVNTVDDTGITLLNFDGTESGEIPVDSMKYWVVTSVRRQVPRGQHKQLSVILGMT